MERDRKRQTRQYRQTHPNIVFTKIKFFYGEELDNSIDCKLTWDEEPDPGWNI